MARTEPHSSRVYEGHGRLLQPQADFYRPAHSGAYPTHFLQQVGGGPSDHLGFGMPGMPRATEDRSRQGGRSPSSFSVLGGSQFRFP
jgi:hypothetical protein